MTAPVLVGRAEECAALRALCESARAGVAGTLVLRGEAGIGKTALLSWVVAQAEGFRVLSCQAEESSLDLPFGPLAQLLEPLRAGLPRLPAPQAAALSSVLGIGPAAGGDRFAVAAATLGLLAQAAEEQPVLLVVDDAQWLELPSAEALLFSLRRLEAERIACVVAARPAPAGPDPFAGLAQLALTGLSEQATAQLLAAGPAGPPGQATLSALVRETGGNPLALLELPAVGAPDVTAAPPQLSERLQRAFGERLAQLPPATRRAVLLLAAGGASGGDVLGAALRLQDLSAADLEAAEAAGLVQVRAEGVSFTHPLVRAASYHGARDPDRRAAHEALATAWQRQSGPRTGERAVRHRAAARPEPDETVAGELAAVADDAAGHGSYASALELYEQAAALSPDADPRAARYLKAAYLTLPSGRVDAASRLVEAVLATSPDWRVRTEARHVRCRVEMWGGRPVLARDLLLRVADETEPQDPVWAAVMLSHAALVSTTLGEQRPAAQTVERAMGLLSEIPDEYAMPVLLLRALIDALGCRPAEARTLLDRCDPHLQAWDPLTSDQLLLVAGLARWSVGEPDAARQWIQRAVEQARAAGAIGLLPFQLAWLSRLEWSAGRWDAAYATAHDAVDLTRETGWTTQLPDSLLALARVEAGTDRPQACRAHCAEAQARAAQLGMSMAQAQSGTVLGLLELGAGRPAEAVRQLRAAQEFASRSGLCDPVLLPWAADLAEALVRSGDRSGAAVPLGVLEQEAALTGRPGARAAAARVRGLLADGEEADAEFLRSRTLYAEAGEPFEQARADLCLGEHLWRTRRREQARTHLQAALTAFERLGARAWAAQAGRELSETGGAARPGSAVSLRELTPQELQVALRVGAGASNAEAAAALFLSKKTIEYHLVNVYRKLGLRSRSQLARALARVPAAVG